jgi:hypothetical protein
LFTETVSGVGVGGTGVFVGVRVGGGSVIGGVGGTGVFVGVGVLVGVGVGVLVGVGVGVLVGVGVTNTSVAESCKTTGSETPDTLKVILALLVIGDAGAVNDDMVL